MTRCLNLIDGIVTASLIAPGEGPIDCSKCLAKMVLFAAEIARTDFPDRAVGYVGLVENLVPSGSLPWAFDDLEREVGWYVKQAGRGIVV